MKALKKLSTIFPQMIKRNKKKKDILFMGAIYEKQSDQHTEDLEENNEDRIKDIEKYFRPSCHAVLNNRITDFQFFQPYYEKSYSEIVIPPSLIDSPEHTIIHYFSILREAENLTNKQMGGCGSVGQAKIPFPIAYNFLQRNIRKRYPFLHIYNPSKGLVIQVL